MMSNIILFLFVCTVTIRSTYAQCSNALYGQCGGNLFKGKSCCPTGSCCEKSDESYSQCRPCATNVNVPTMATSGAPTNLAKATDATTFLPTLSSLASSAPSASLISTTKTTISPTSDKSVCGLQWGQCGGGPEYKGPFCCVSGFCCTYNSFYYSQCLPCPFPSADPTKSIPTPVNPPSIVASSSLPSVVVSSVLSQKPVVTSTSTFPTSALTSQPTLATTSTTTLSSTVSKTSTPSLAQSRTNCVQENFDTLNFQYFDAVSCPGGMSILSGGYLNLHISQGCSTSRIDSKVFYQNAYVETRFKIGGQGPDFSGLVYAFYTDGILKPNNKHADEIDIEIVGYGNPGRGWAAKTAQLGFWEPGFDLFQHYIQDGPWNLEEFNTYALQWNYDTIDFFINGVKRFSSSQFDTSIGYVQPEKVIYSLWDGTPYPDFSAAMNWNSPRSNDFNMVIDYVKICT